MAESAIDRASRALDLVPYILAHEGVSIDELAKEFNTTTVGITNDLNLLFVCGLPGYTPLELIDLSYEDGIVTIIDPQVLRAPRKFTPTEITSLLLALDLLNNAHLPNSQVSQLISGLRIRLSSLLKDRARNLIAMPLSYAAEIMTNLQFIQSAIKEGFGISCEYISATNDIKTTRQIIPLSIIAKDEHLYLSGYSIEKRENRTFRLDRISLLERISLADPSVNSEVLHELVQVRLKLKHSAINFAEAHSSIIDSEEIAADGRILVISISDPEWILREVMKYAGAISILGPSNLTKELSERAQKALSQY